MAKATAVWLVVLALIAFPGKAQKDDTCLLQTSASAKKRSVGDLGAKEDAKQEDKQVEAHADEEERDGSTSKYGADVVAHVVLPMAEQKKTRLSSCFQKPVDVLFGDTYRKSIVCKQSKVEAKAETGELHMSYDSDSRTLCIAGRGFQTRAESTVHMIKDAVHSLDKSCQALSQFEHKIINIADTTDCNHDMAYSADTLDPICPFHFNGPASSMTGKRRKVHKCIVCKTKLIPDYAFYKWPEAGLLPDYNGLAPLLATLGAHPATERRCGWAGNIGTNAIRGNVSTKVKNSSLFDIVIPKSLSGPGGQGGRISMEDQVRRWACFVELPANGYSGRVPYVLHSGRPMLLVERRRKPLAPTWYSHLLKPWVHYIPVRHDLVDLFEKAKFALGITPGSNATKIAAAAQEFARSHLSYDAAINHLAESLLELSQGS